MNCSISNWRKYCPKHLPHVILLLLTPVRKAFGFHLTYTCSSFLSPYAICLVCSTLIMLNESCLCCGVVSAYHDKGEKTAWRTWNAWSEASTVFRKLSQYPPVLGKDDQSILEKFGPKYCPKHLPHVILLLPTPVRKTFGFHLTYSSFFSPYANCFNCSELPTAYEEWLQD
jgi:hypothetical protein